MALAYITMEQGKTIYLYHNIIDSNIKHDFMKENNKNNRFVCNKCGFKATLSLHRDRYLYLTSKIQNAKLSCDEIKFKNLLE